MPYVHLSMTYQQLLNASLSEIEAIRRQSAAYCRPPLTAQALTALWAHLDALYTNRPQRNFAQQIYMKAA